MTINFPKSAIFVEVDAQNDFLHPDGKLSVHAPAHVLSNIRKLSQHAPTLIGSVDTHFPDSWEFNTNNKKGPDGEEGIWPPHCLKNSQGWLRTYAADRPNAQFVPADAAQIEWFTWTDAVFLEKEVYSLFVNPFAKNVLTWAEGRVDAHAAVVYGVATEYCVKAAVLGLLEHGLEVFVATDAIWGVDYAAHHKALQEMYGEGATFVPTSLVLSMWTAFGQPPHKS